jgi:hypothetical protein
VVLLSKRFGETIWRIGQELRQGVHMGKRVRISDVAAEAGVSISTVSVILNEVYGDMVSPE